MLRWESGWREEQHGARVAGAAPQSEVGGVGDEAERAKAPGR